MKNILFLEKHHYYLKMRVIHHYRRVLKEIEKKIETGKGRFEKKLGTILRDTDLKSYTSLKFFWVSLVEDYFFLNALHKDPIDNAEEIFEYWEKSEFCDSFISLIGKNNSILDSSNFLIKNIESQIISFYSVHFGKGLRIESSYFPVPEIGDFSKRLYLSDAHLFVDLKNSKRGPLKIQKMKGLFLKVWGQGKLPIQKGDFLISNTQIYLIPTCKEGISRFREFKAKIERALKILEHYAPESFSTFMSFTNTILPINEPGIVSYSLQNLPGYSLINLFERDFLDLLDDLLHENGHHYLNTYLNFTELINEDDAKIYYSPWRKSLRPVRGIFHACFTFFWAFHLFGNLFRKLDRIDFFSANEKEKITTRFIEEYLMLNYCLPDLKHAFKHKKINNEGMKLIRQVYSQIEPFKKDLKIAIKQVGHKPKLVLLKLDLEEKRKKYSLN